MNDYPKSVKWRSPISISGSWTKPWSIRGSYMSKFLLGIILTVCVLVYGAEIRKFTVDTGIRDKVVAYLKSWWEGYPKSFFDLGIPKSYLFWESAILKYPELLNKHNTPNDLDSQLNCPLQGIQDYCRNTFGLVQRKEYECHSLTDCVTGRI